MYNNQREKGYLGIAQNANDLLSRGHQQLQSSEKRNNSQEPSRSYQYQAL